MTDTKPHGTHLDIIGGTKPSELVDLDALDQDIKQACRALESDPPRDIVRLADGLMAGSTAITHARELRKQVKAEHHRADERDKEWQRALGLPVWSDRTPEKWGDGDKYAASLDKLGTYQIVYDDLQKAKHEIRRLKTALERITGSVKACRADWDSEDGTMQTPDMLKDLEDNLT